MGFQSRQKPGACIALNEYIMQSLGNQMQQILVKLECLKCLCFIGTSDFIRCLGKQVCVCLFGIYLPLLP